MANELDTEQELDADAQTAQSDDINDQEHERDEPQQGDKPDTTDWKAQARKWERRAKQYKAKLDTTGQESVEKQDDTSGADDDGEFAQRIAELEAENRQLKAAGERRMLMERVAKDTGVPASLLHGDSEQELRATAESLKQWASTLGRNTPTSLGSEPDTPQSANLELIHELFNEQ